MVKNWVAIKRSLDPPTMEYLNEEQLSGSECLDWDMFEVSFDTYVQINNKQDEHYWQYIIKSASRICFLLIISQIIEFCIKVNTVFFCANGGQCWCGFSMWSNIISWTIQNFVDFFPLLMFFDSVSHQKKNQIHKHIN